MMDGGNLLHAVRPENPITHSTHSIEAGELKTIALAGGNVGDERLGVVPAVVKGVVEAHLLDAYGGHCTERSEEGKKSGRIHFQRL
jgi:hypothetical protein